ncbi:asparagine synthase-related protein [Ruminiclostridium josui]|uniref:asparagine synthase-related protein n=1 Tax=Ruminiclostridium josui TaxID=1499 RepID=UPI003BF4F315
MYLCTFLSGGLDSSVVTAVARLIRKTGIYYPPIPLNMKEISSTLPLQASSPKAMTVMQYG